MKKFFIVAAALVALSGTQALAENFDAASATGANYVGNWVGAPKHVKQVNIYLSHDVFHKVCKPKA